MPLAFLRCGPLSFYKGAGNGFFCAAHFETFAVGHFAFFQGFYYSVCTLSFSTRRCDHGLDPQAALVGHMAMLYFAAAASRRCDRRIELCAPWMAFSWVPLAAFSPGRERRVASGLTWKRVSGLLGYRFRRAGPALGPSDVIRAILGLRDQATVVSHAVECHAGNVLPVRGLYPSGVSYQRLILGPRDFVPFAARSAWWIIHAMVGTK